MVKIENLFFYIGNMTSEELNRFKNLIESPDNFVAEIDDILG